MSPRIPTPRTATACYNGYAELVKEAEEMERQLAYARQTLEEVYNALETATSLESGALVDCPDWISEALTKIKHPK